MRQQVAEAFGKKPVVMGESQNDKKKIFYPYAFGNIEKLKIPGGTENLEIVPIGTKSKYIEAKNSATLVDQEKV